MPPPAGPTSRRAEAAGLPASAGVGLKPQHVADALAAPGAVGFYEVHAENYMVAGGAAHRDLRRIREEHAISLHGVGLSLGSPAPLDTAHLDRLAALVARYEPAAVSEHLAWSGQGGIYYNDLLPISYDDETLGRVCEHVDRLQQRLARRVLIENPATYVEFERSTLAEAQFLCEVVARSGCGLLLDLSNAHVAAVNHHRDVDAYLAALPLHAVGEVHLAGYAEDRDAAGDLLLIDSHGCPVDATVWQLYERTIARLGPTPTLIERDNDVPAFDVLVAEADRAERIMRRHGALKAAG